MKTKEELQKIIKDLKCKLDETTKKLKTLIYYIDGNLKKEKHII